MIRYSYDLSRTFCLSKCCTGKQTFAWVWPHPRGFFITFLSLWRDHKICPSLCSFEKKKKKCSTSFTCKTKGVREGEGEGRGWFWHIFSAVIMDPSHRMICSYTWLTELSSINKHSNTSTCRYKRQISIVFRAQTPLRCLADLSLSLLSVFKKKEARSCFFAHLTSRWPSISGTSKVTFSAVASVTDPPTSGDIKREGERGFLRRMHCSRTHTHTHIQRTRHLPSLQ